MRTRLVLNSFVASAAIGLCIAAQSPLFAGTILSSTASFSASGTSANVLSWAQFDTTLGTLTSVSLTFSGSSSGSFLVNANQGVDASIANPKALIKFQFSAGTSTPSQLSGNGSLSTNPSAPATVTDGNTTTFTFPSTAISGSRSAWTSLAYFEGTGSFTTTVTNGISGITDGSTDYSNVSALGTATLSYEYTPVPVPEPSTYAMAAVGVGIFSLISWRRRAASN